MYLIKCLYCGKEFQAKRNSALCCGSKECTQAQDFKNLIKRSIKRNEDKVEGLDYVTCRICGYQGPNISIHIKTHNISTKEYKQIHNAPLLCSSLNDKMKGQNNPSYNHDGKYSPFSKKFIKYENLTDDQKQEQIHKIAVDAQATAIANNNLNTRIEYYIARGLNEEDAKQALYERQKTFSYEKCISELGIELGTIKFQERQDRWQNTLNSKSSDERSEINKKKSHSGNTLKKSSLNIKFKSFLVENDIPFQEEYYIRRIDCNNKGYFYDFRIGDTVIELNGDYFHASPDKYRPGDIIHHHGNDYLVDDIWENDKTKYDLAVYNNLKCLIFWESDIKNNFEKIKNITYGIIC